MDGGWLGFAMGALGLLGAIAAKVDARKVARDKAESDRLAARDKMEFDAKLLALEADHVNCAQNTTEMKAEIAKCRDQHAESERDRAEMKGQISVLKTLLATQVAPKSSAVGC